MTKTEVKRMLINFLMFTNEETNELIPFYVNYIKNNSDIINSYDSFKLGYNISNIMNIHSSLSKAIKGNKITEDIIQDISIMCSDDIFSIVLDSLEENVSYLSKDEWLEYKNKYKNGYINMTQDKLTKLETNVNKYIDNHFDTIFPQYIDNIVYY